MKFRFLIIALWAIILSMGSYAQDYVSFDVTSATLTENNWDDGGDNSAELIIMAISESYSGKRTQLTIPADGKSISASLNSRISLEEYAGLHIPIGKDIVRVYLFAFDADQINSALSIAGGAFVKLTTKMIATDAWKYFKKFKKSNFYSFVAGEAVGLGYDEAKKYLEENDDLGRAVVEIHKNRIPSGEQVIRGIEGGIKFTYKIKLERGDSSSSSSSTQSTSTSKWFSPTKKRASWKKAKQICRDNGGRLPTIEELKEVVRDCGGINITWGDKDWDSVADKNKANKSYQACYKRKGFPTSNGYWSSTTGVSVSSRAWCVFFYDGGDLRGDKAGEGRVRCVKGGQ